MDCWLSMMSNSRKWIHSFAISLIAQLKDIKKYNEKFEDYLFDFDIDITVGFIDKEIKKFETMVNYEFGI